MNVEIGKKYRFISTSATNGYPGWRERSGDLVTVVAAIEEPDRDEDVEPMYLCIFVDKTRVDAFEDELYETT